MFRRSFLFSPIVSLAIFVGGFVLASFATSDWLRIVGLLPVIAVALGTTIKWVVNLASRFAVLQKSVAELLATLFFSGICATVVVAHYPTGSLESYVGLLVAPLWGIAGAAWAWSRARRLQRQRPTRLTLLVFGWLGLAGLAGALTLFFSLAAILDSIHTRQACIRRIAYSTLFCRCWSRCG